MFQVLREQLGLEPRGDHHVADFERLCFVIRLSDILETLASNGLEITLKQIAFSPSQNNKKKLISSHACFSLNISSMSRINERLIFKSEHMKGRILN